MVVGGGRPGVRRLECELLSDLGQLTHLTARCLTFFICEMEMRIPYRIVMTVKWDDICEMD